MAQTPAQTDRSTQTPTEYFAQQDANYAVFARMAANFAPHEQAAPDMTVRVNAGTLWTASGLTEVAAQDSATIAAPTVNPRIDRLVLDPLSGAVSVVAGTEAAEPSAPAITTGQLPLAQVLLAVDQTSIVNANITDERVVAMPAMPLRVSQGGTGATTAAGARSALGLVIGTDVLAPDGDGSNLTGFGDGAYEDAATQAQAEAGEDNSAYMTSLRVAQAIAALAGGGVPVGLVAHYFGTTAPDGWLIRDGSTVSRTTYADLFAVLGTTFGVGDGSTTFNLPDDRSRFDRGLPSGGTVGTAETEATNGSGLSMTYNTGVHDPSSPYYANVVGAAFTQTGGGYLNQHQNTVGAAYHISGGTETRPINRHYLPVIKY